MYRYIANSMYKKIKTTYNLEGRKYFILCVLLTCYLFIYSLPCQHIELYLSFSLTAGSKIVTLFSYPASNFVPTVKLNPLQIIGCLKVFFVTGCRQKYLHILVPGRGSKQTICYYVHPHCRAHRHQSRSSSRWSKIF